MVSQAKDLGWSASRDEAESAPFRVVILSEGSLLDRRPTEIEQLQFPPDAFRNCSITSAGLALFAGKIQLVKNCDVPPAVVFCEDPRENAFADGRGYLRGVCRRSSGHFPR